MLPPLGLISFVPSAIQHANIKETIWISAYIFNNTQKQNINITVQLLITQKAVWWQTQEDPLVEIRKEVVKTLLPLLSVRHRQHLRVSQEPVQDVVGGCRGV